METLDRYDIDGLELDFMREPYLFSAGKEAEGAPILTAWLREIRKLVDDAAAKRGHPIRLGVRVPSRPEVASAMGLDALDLGQGRADRSVGGHAAMGHPGIRHAHPAVAARCWERRRSTLAGGLEVLLPAVSGRAGDRSLRPSWPRGPPFRSSRRARTRFTFSTTFQDAISWLAPARLSEHAEGHGVAGLLAEAAAIAWASRIETSRRRARITSRPCRRRARKSCFP